MANIVSLSVIKKQIENSSKQEAVKIVDKYVNDLIPKIKEELTQKVISNLFAIVESSTDDYKTDINIIFEDSLKPKKGVKNAGND